MRELCFISGDGLIDRFEIVSLVFARNDDAGWKAAIDDESGKHEPSPPLVAIDERLDDYAVGVNPCRRREDKFRPFHEISSRAGTRNQAFRLPYDVV